MSHGARGSTSPPRRYITLGRLSFSVLGDGRAAGLRRDRRALARQVRPDLDARLGADSPGGESGYTAGDPLNPGVVYGGDGQRWNLDANIPIEGTTSPEVTGDSARRLDAAAGVLESGPEDVSTTQISFCSRPATARRRGRRSVPISLGPMSVIPPTLDATAAAATDRNGKRGVIYTIAPSPLRAPLLWIGTDDGLIQLTTDDGKSWQNVTPAAITPWSRVTMIEASHFDPGSAYASVDRHQLQDFEPYIYRTRDMGKSWQRITNGLPAGVYVQSVKEDPQRRGLLVAARSAACTSRSTTATTGSRSSSTCPVTSMRDFEIYGNDLIVATHGRGFWVIDDISPLRQVNDAVAA